MKQTDINKAIANVVKECGCSHCIWIVREALGTTEEVSKFWGWTTVADKETKKVEP